MAAGEEPVLSQSIVALFDEVNSARITALHRELERAFGRQDRMRSEPHCTLQSADSYDSARMEDCLRAAAKAIGPLTLTASGLGVFPGSSNSLHLPVVRNAEVQNAYEEVFTQFVDSVSGVRDYMLPDLWMPHVSVAYRLTGRQAGEAVALLCDRDLRMQIPVAALGWFVSDDDSPRVPLRIPLAH